MAGGIMAAQGGGGGGSSNGSDGENGPIDPSLIAQGGSAPIANDRGTPGGTGAGAAADGLLNAATPGGDNNDSSSLGGGGGGGGVGRIGFDLPECPGFPTAPFSPQPSCI
jgi:hypothetical protein